MVSGASNRAPAFERRPIPETVISWRPATAEGAAIPSKGAPANAFFIADVADTFLTISAPCGHLPPKLLQSPAIGAARWFGEQFSVLPPENATGNFTKIVQRVPVRILLDDGASTLGRLRPGLSVTAAVDERSSGEEAR
jgi:membrane fusion protein, multidrug efflux system